MKKYIYVYAIIFTTCTAMKTNQSTVYGNAYNVKRGAIIIDKDGKQYFIDGLVGWEEKYLERKVKVVGEVIDTTHTVEPYDSNTIEQRVIYKDSVIVIHTIMNAKWELTN